MLKEESNINTDLKFICCRLIMYKVGQK